MKMKGWFKRDYTQRIVYGNGTDGELRITVEPWGNEVAIQPGQEIDVMVRSDTLDGTVRLEQTTNGLTIWADVGGTVITLVSEGQEIT
jgi:hypothetical protein